MHGLNALGSLTFGAGLIGLFLTYPRRLVPVWAAWVPSVVLATWWAVNQAGLLPSFDVGLRLPILLALIAIFVCVALQYRATRDDLAARAVLRLFGLGIVVGAGGSGSGSPAAGFSIQPRSTITRMPFSRRSGVHTR